MNDLKERLDKLRATIQDPDFLEGNGLSNEVNIRMFCYDPAEEMLVKHFIRQIMDDRSLNCHPIEYDLYKLFLSICEDKRILNRMSAMEEKKGKAFIQKQLERVANHKAFVQKMSQVSYESGDVILITGVGEVFPFLRVHDLLNAMQKVIPVIPIVVFYPGSFDGHGMQLFNRLEKNSYYRAFNEI